MFSAEERRHLAAGNPEIPVVLWGGGGLAGTELLRLLVIHPRLFPIAVLSRSQAGRRIAGVHPSLSALGDLEFSDPAVWDWDRLPPGPGVIFAALEHGEAMAVLPEFLELFRSRGYLVVDLSGDFRLPDAADYPIHYGRNHLAPGWLGFFVYGLCELNRPRLGEAWRIANPGCFATGAQLAILPLAASGLPMRGVAIDGKTGSSGAGLKPRPSTHHPLRAGNCEAYKLQGHAHFGEISRGWCAAGGDPGVELSFVPQMTPMVRGIYTTVHAFLEQPGDAGEISEMYRNYYREAPLVRFQSEPPAMNQVAGTSRCDLSVTVLGRRVVVCTAIDNLLKGAAGQAVQNANLAFGWPEDLGLQTPPPWPI